MRPAFRVRIEHRTHLCRVDRSGVLARVLGRRARREEQRRRFRLLVEDAVKQRRRAVEVLRLEIAPVLYEYYHAFDVARPRGMR